jgi:hypothetical protein
MSSCSLQQKVLLDSRNIDLLHHMDLYECDPAAVFDDKKLPDDLWDDIADEIKLCASNLVSVWAVGGDTVR